MANEKSWGCLGIVIGVIVIGIVLIVLSYLYVLAGGAFDP